MPKIIANIDITLKIPPNFKNLNPSNTWLEIEFTAEEPKEVTQQIADYYTKNRPQVFRKEKAAEVHPMEKIENPPPVKEFDAVVFLQENYDNISAGLETLENPVRPKLMTICKLLKFNDFTKQKNERLFERIINDIEAKKKHDEKMSSGDNNTPEG